MNVDDYMHLSNEELDRLAPAIRIAVKRAKWEAREVVEVEPGPTEEELWQCDINLGLLVDHDDVKFPTYVTDNCVGAYYDKRAKEWVRGTRSRSVGPIMGQVGLGKLESSTRKDNAHNRYLQGQGLTIEQIMEVDTRSREQLLELPALPTIEDILVRLRFIVRESSKELHAIEASADFQAGKSAAKTRAYFTSQRLQEAVQKLRKAENFADYQPTRPRAGR